jgi:predicted nucleic acid-binding protein
LVTLEHLYGARARRVRALAEPGGPLPLAVVDDRVLDRALEVAGLMAERGLHGGAKPMDLAIAAAAEASRLTLLHYDADFDRIASVTNQPTEWVAPAGSLD